MVSSPPAIPPDFSSFTPFESEIHKILSKCPNNQCDSDPILTRFLKDCASVLVSAITNIANLSVISGKFHPTYKECVISALLKKQIRQRSAV